jgi:hypothetical protein
MGFVSCVQVKKREKEVKAGRAGDWAGGGFEERLFRCLNWEGIRPQLRMRGGSAER